MGGSPASALPPEATNASWCGGQKGCPRSKYQAFMKKALPKRKENVKKVEEIVKED